MTLVIGVDPGPTTGIVALWVGLNDYYADTFVVQCNHPAALPVIGGLMRLTNGRVVLAVERFVVGRKSMRAGQHGQVTRDLVANLSKAHTGISLVSRRSASDVKPWATDERLDAAGLLGPCRGMGHARDAARHALYAAVRDCDMPDPLSHKARAR